MYKLIDANIYIHVVLANKATGLLSDPWLIITPITNRLNNFKHL